MTAPISHSTTAPTNTNLQPREHCYLTTAPQYHLRLRVAQGLILNSDSLSGTETKGIAVDIMNGDNRLGIQGNKYVFTIADDLRANVSLRLC